MQCLRFVLIGAASIAAFGSSGASAQHIEGKFQLALATDVLSYDSTTSETDGSDSEVESKTVNWGFQDRVTLELGYGLSEMVVLGGLITLGGSSHTIETEAGEGPEVSRTTVIVGPKLDLLFSEGETARPFIGAHIALASTSQSVEDGAETSLTGFQLGARAGVHWFAVDGASLAPAVSFKYVSTSGENDSDGVGGGTDISASGFEVALELALAAWLG